MQKIYYGAPGTGKSYKIDELIKSKSIPDEQVFRITFHPEYSYSDFVGQILPTVIKSGPHKGDVTYEFKKGIFTLALEKAYEDTSKEIYLIIEEMNRGNCASIFGDVFQLLDRENAGVYKGYSRYFINNDLIAKDIVALLDDKVKLPPNFNIIATVNTSDQNVYVMDNAFKRRFEWSYVSTSPVGTPAKNNISIELFDGTSKFTIDWVKFYTKLNVFINSDKYLGLGEDKQIGQFFIEFDLTKGWNEHKKVIQDKLLQYLWFDINKSSYKTNIKLFDNSVSCFAELYDGFDQDKKVFSDSFIVLLK